VLELADRLGLDLPNPLARRFAPMTKPERRVREVAGLL
jgi:hypothetical protein